MPNVKFNRFYRYSDFMLILKAYVKAKKGTKFRLTAKHERAGLVNIDVVLK